ncbi:monocarboxylate transporter 5 [Strongylocentrotus purpuratus]|uniref:Monocarboxylate transporter n=1 Tax=Strongylocentrotus purpuratus TaxID=7668 RepID=A0A7M7FZY2_STRPU|nr:monocarboxylate transporter 5 [Strongylocentrotus purpuratus]|eukprot:XP_001183644.2 PREDICTED: monocarboxylate transporter 5 [Strongylocentrotus purpuratus]
MAICEGPLNVAAIKTTLVLFLQTLYALGTLKSIGVYVPEMIEGVGLTPTDIGLSLGLYGAFAFIPGPFITYLYQRLHGGSRWVLVMTGAVLAPLALIAGSFVTNAAQLAVCLSVAGLASNILSIAIVITLRKQCSQNFGIYYGIGKSGYAFGMALVPLLADYLMVLYGWRGSYILIGALMGHLIPTTMMVDINLESDVRDTRSSNDGASEEQRVQMDHEVNDDNRRLLDEASSHSRDTAASSSVHNPDHPSSGEDNVIDEQDEPVDEVDDEAISDETRLLEESSLRHRHKTKSDSSRRISEATSRTKYANLYDTACQILKNSVYNRDRWLIHLMLVTLVYSMVNGTWNGFLIPRAVDRGFATPVAVSFAYSAAVGAFIGRFFGGFILSLKFFSGQEWFLFLTIVNISSLIADILVARFGVMIVTSFVTCLTLAERSTLILVICTDRVTESEFPVILASSEIVFGIGTFVGASLGGYVAYAYNAFNASYVFVAAADALVFFLMIPPTIAARMK